MSSFVREVLSELPILLSDLFNTDMCLMTATGTQFRVCVEGVVGVGMGGWGRGGIHGGGGTYVDWYGVIMGGRGGGHV